MSAGSLAAALAEQELDVGVDVVGGVAVLTSQPGRSSTVAAALSSPATRQMLVGLAAAHGFTHVAFELTADARSASLPGD